MQAIHVNWTKPSCGLGGEYFIEDFEILTTVLSALKWREKNGKIKMITDTIGFEFYKSRGMCGIWDEIETSLDDMPETVNDKMFWAGGKLYALSKCKAPVAVIDTDFIVWDRLAFDNLGDISVIHDEDIYCDVYPNINHFNMKEGYVFNKDWDWTVKPINAAFYVIKNEKFLNEYTSAAMDFIENSMDGDNLTYMVFAEQRLFSMIAKKMGIDILKISNLERLFKDGEKCFSHIWGMKQQMRDMPELRFDFCKRCVNRIIKDFPEYSEMIKNIPELEIYYK